MVNSVESPRHGQGGKCRRYIWATSYHHFFFAYCLSRFACQCLGLDQPNSTEEGPGTFCFKINQDCVTFKDIIVYWGLNSFEWSDRVRCRQPVSKHRLVILLSGSRCHLSRFVQPLTLPQQTAQRLGNIFYSSWCCVQWMSLTEMMNYILTYVF